MSVLLLRIGGPIQSWGDSSSYDVRKTNLYPTKSGIVGLLAAACGRGREEPIDDLASLKYGFRIESQGIEIVDYQIVSHMEKPKPNPELSDFFNRGKTVQLYKHYLADAVFLVGIEGEELLIHQLSEALKRPGFHLYAGRRGCPLAVPYNFGIQGGDLETVLRSYPSVRKVTGINQRFKRNQTETNAPIYIEGTGGVLSTLKFMKPVTFSKDKKQNSYMYLSQYHPAKLTNSNQSVQETARWPEVRMDFFKEVENFNVFIKSEIKSEKEKDH